MRERNAHAPVVPWVELAEAARPPVEQRRARPVASVGVRALKSCNGRKRPKIFKNIIERGPITHRRHFSVITKSAREKITGSTHKRLAIPSVDDQSIFLGKTTTKNINVVVSDAIHIKQEFSRDEGLWLKFVFSLTVFVFIISFARLHKHLK